MQEVVGQAAASSSEEMQEVAEQEGSDSVGYSNIDLEEEEMVMEQGAVAAFDGSSDDDDEPWELDLLLEGLDLE